MKKLFLTIICFSLVSLCGAAKDTDNNASKDPLALAIERLDLKGISKLLDTNSYTQAQKLAYLEQIRAKKESCWITYMGPRLIKPGQSALIGLGAVGLYGCLLGLIFQYAVYYNPERHPEIKRTYILPTWGVAATIIAGFAWMVRTGNRKEERLKEDYFTAGKIERMLTKIPIC